MLTELNIQKLRNRNRATKIHGAYAYQQLKEEKLRRVIQKSRKTGLEMKGGVAK